MVACVDGHEDKKKGTPTRRALNVALACGTHAKSPVKPQERQITSCNQSSKLRHD